MADKSITNEFNAALRRFTLNMENIPPDVTHPSIVAACMELCKLLRISQFDVSLTEPMVGKTMSRTAYHEHQFYHEGEPDLENAIEFVRTTLAGSIVRYLVSPHKNAEKWNDEELECIDSFMSAMFILNGRSRAMHICELLTYHDTEIDVYNTTFFIRKLNELIAKHEITNYTAIHFNLRKFSIVNNQIGRENGTRVMKKYIQGLKEIAGEDGYIARLGGDNFVALFKHELIPTVKDYLVGTSVQTGVVGLETVNVSSRAGYFRIDDDTILAADIMDKLTMMLSMLKQNPSIPYMNFDEEVNEKAENKRWVEGCFQEALKKEEFIVYYQPKVNLKNYTLAGAEALCRWKHDGELIPPYRFIPILEQSSNICLLDFYMLEHVCKDMRRWLDEGRQVVKVSVNISRVHLGNENLAARIIDIVEKYGIPNELIEIELTETTTDVDFTELKRVVSMLHSVGISTSIDDFGIGYSSLNLIRELPWNVLKIDKSFLPMENEKNYNQKKIMLKYVIAMAQTLGLECIVEGVETLEHVSLLKENNCFRAQGFFFDKPLPVEDFEKRLFEKQNIL